MKFRREKPGSSILRRKPQKTPKMLCPRVVMLLLTLHWFMEEISAAAMMTENTRDLETLTHRHLEGELPTGDGTEMKSDNGLTQIETPQAPTQHPSTQNQNQFQYIRRKNEKRRKVIPLDSIGRFKI